MRQARFTIGLPVYNALPYLQEAVGSLLGQSFGDFEILAIVDGATDGSLDYLHSVRDERLRILTQANAGVAATLNRMLKETRTPWLVRQDADDLSYPDRLAKMDEAIAAHPKAGMIYSLAEYQGGSVGLFRSTRGSSSERRKLVERGYLPAICHSTVALRVQAVRALGGYRTGLHAEDPDLWWRMVLMYETHLIPEVLVGFRQNEGSVSTRHFKMQELHGIYVQYLLLSHLHGWRASSWEEAAPRLAELLSPRWLRAKEHLRCCNMRLGEGLWGAAADRLVRSMIASPSYLARRLRDEFAPGSRIANGLPPGMFLERKEWLWPLQFGTAPQLTALQTADSVVCFPGSRSTG
ncbi:glycosyltransferase family 2 protein [Acidipila rosea]|uniref:Glycosyltransferase involved in cell wall biosynthesis n=1 Tax=Acidipila rosea TaxID=768535 RepID=A0A4R1LGE2_9BACT|nr:glycosyltransferase [Acidipila rosea]TCK75769.1 glycosyltransferase involved in cell wall biosynthesis [Acidipila rosea]